jgi:hypothetical protein
VKTWFQSLLFQILNLDRYSAEQQESSAAAMAQAVGLCTLNSFDP